MPKCLRVSLFYTVSLYYLECGLIYVLIVAVNGVRRVMYKCIYF